MAVDEIPLAELGLVTVEDFAKKCKRTVRAVQRWIEHGKIPAVVVGAGHRTMFLLRVKDVTRFSPPPVGRPRTPISVRKTPRAGGAERRLTRKEKARKQAKAETHFAEQLFANLDAHFGDDN